MIFDVLLKKHVTVIGFVGLLLGLALLSGCDLLSSDSDDGEELFLGIVNPDFYTTIDIQLHKAQDANFAFSSERVEDNRQLGFHIKRTIVEKPDTFEFVLSHVNAIDDDGTAYGCTFKGRGNPVNSTVTEGVCLFQGKFPGDYLRLDVTEPVEAKIHDRTAGSILLDNMRMERVQNGWQRVVGMGRISMRYGATFGLPTNPEPDLDPGHPMEDPWKGCPKEPICVQGDVSTVEKIVSLSDIPQVCEAWSLKNTIGDVSLTMDQGHMHWDPSYSNRYVRDAFSCSLFGFSGSLDTRSEFDVDLVAQTITVTMRQNHVEVIGGVTYADQCTGVWHGSIKSVDCN
ncbi:MAG: hypothetical protein M0R76_07790 [Proteobacteria bacterium]|nr:hypothetical protein [Pseudomonadota bacterium]